MQLEHSTEKGEGAEYQMNMNIHTVHARTLLKINCATCISFSSMTLLAMFSADSISVNDARRAPTL